MKKDELKVNVKIDEDGDVKVTIAEEAKNKIPRVGDSIFVIEPYNADDDAEEDDFHEKPIKAYSYAPVFVKGTILNDEADEVLVNGDYRIPLYKDTEVNRKLLVYTNEEKALEKWTTLMTTSLHEAERRTEKAKAVEGYVREALKKVNH
jgi:hypothetical protein